jgi:hypothetical protein
MRAGGRSTGAHYAAAGALGPDKIFRAAASSPHNVENFTTSVAVLFQIQRIKAMDIHLHGGNSTAGLISDRLHLQTINRGIETKSRRWGWRRPAFPGDFPHFGGANTTSSRCCIFDG